MCIYSYMQMKILKTCISHLLRKNTNMNIWNKISQNVRGRDGKAIWQIQIAFIKKSCLILLFRYLCRV